MTSVRAAVAAVAAALGLGLVAGAAGGCRSSPSSGAGGADARAGEAVASATISAAGSTAATAACVPRVAEKLGVRFLRVCPSTLAAGVDLAPFWIGAVPSGCSAGEHDTLRCPPVLSVAQPRTADPPELRAASTGLAAVVESETAHKICTMRFAGRLPTRAERSLARSALGMASVLVTESNEISGYRLHELSEWVTETACDHPTVLGPECRPHGFPSDATPTIPWEVVTRCDASPVAALDARTLIGIDGECVVSRTAMDSSAEHTVPCLVRGPAIDPRGRRDAALALSCGARGPAPSRLTGLAPDVAAFRCVLPEWQ